MQDVDTFPWQRTTTSIEHSGAPLAIEPPPWVSSLANAYAAPPPADGCFVDAPGTQYKLAGFMHVIAPLVDRARRRVRDGLAALQASADMPRFDPAVIETALFANLPSRLIAQLSRTLALELHVLSLQGLLAGDTTEARFQHFVARLGHPDVALRLFAEYPVLARQMVEALDRWQSVSLEFARRLTADWPELRAAFHPRGETGPLVNVAAGAGDPHRGGRSVVILEFATGFRLVYKPRSLAVDRHTQELLAWLNARGANPSFRTLTILDRDDHGWVEFVQAAPCVTPAEVARYYRRYGGTLALLYTLEAIDFHHENVIAAGEHPVLLDLEALFHPRVIPVESDRAHDVAADRINHSVIGTGLLPQRLYGAGGTPGMDVSGLGLTERQVTPFAVPRWADAGTDGMRLTREPIEFASFHNRPMLDGAPTDPLAHAEEIATGFADLYRLLVRHREELLADGGPLARFAGDEVRVLLRPTRTYHRLLEEAFHPDLLGDALVRDRFFDRLWATTTVLPSLERVIPSEQADLWRGDIPLFTTRPDSRAIWPTTGAAIADFFDESGLDLVRRRAANLGDADLRRQLWLVRASLATIAPSSRQEAAAPPRPPNERAAPSADRLVAAATRIGDHLASTAVLGDDDATWIGVTQVAESTFSVAPLDLDLYDGLPGVALFLAHLGAVTNEARFTDLARRASLALIRRTADRRDSLHSIGAFDGWGGVIYAQADLAQLWGDPALLDEARAVAAALPDLIDADTGFDVIGGAAGAIAGLLALHAVDPGRGALDLARRAGERLLATAVPQEEGVAWPSALPERLPLTGFSHGTAGIAWALLRLFGATGDERFRVTAREAIAYERSRFVPEVGNWEDLRTNTPAHLSRADDRPVSMTGWCHGAPGIGLARLDTLAQLDDPAAAVEVTVALRTTIDHGFAGSHCLCHGALGNLDLVLESSRKLDSAWRRELDQWSDAILADVERHGPRCANSLGVETPGLMTGLAGIGYQLLRLADPDRVPSVLTLASPVGAGIAAGRSLAGVARWT